MIHVMGGWDSIGVWVDTCWPSMIEGVLDTKYDTHKVCRANRIHLMSIHSFTSIVLLLSLVPKYLSKKQKSLNLSTIQTYHNLSIPQSQAGNSPTAKTPIIPSHTPGHWPFYPGRPLARPWSRNDATCNKHLKLVISPLHLQTLIVRIPQTIAVSIEKCSGVWLENWRPGKSHLKMGKFHSISKTSFSAQLQLSASEFSPRVISDIPLATSTSLIPHLFTISKSQSPSSQTQITSQASFHHHHHTEPRVTQV